MEIKCNIFTSILLIHSRIAFIIFVITFVFAKVLVQFSKTRHAFFSYISQKKGAGIV